MENFKISFGLVLLGILILFLTAILFDGSWALRLCVGVIGVLGFIIGVASLISSLIVKTIFKNKLEDH